MTKNRARLIILSEILSFPTICNKDWHSDFGDSKPQIGDLIALQSAPATKWYLSWLREIGQDSPGWPKYLLESIEDGALCWWSNVGLSYYNRETIANRPTWKWDDGQHKFNDRWLKVCRNNDAYIVLPCQPTFNNDESVLLDVRIRFQFSDYRNPRTFPNWKKVTMKQMDDYYKESSKEYEATSKKKST